MDGVAFKDHLDEILKLRAALAVACARFGGPVRGIALLSAILRGSIDGSD